MEPIKETTIVDTNPAEQTSQSAPVASTQTQAEVGTMNQQYAGFWIRFGAGIIDAIILGFAGLILGAIFTGGASLTASAGTGASQNFISTILFLVYYIWMESSSKQATIGKMVCGLKVTDTSGNRLSVLRATGRTFSKYLSGVILLIGYIMIAFTEKKQGLHDLIAHTFVVKK